MELCSVVLVGRANSWERTFASIVDAGDWLMRRHKFGSLSLVRSTGGTWQLWVSKGMKRELLYDRIKGGSRTVPEILADTILRLLRDLGSKLGFDLRIFSARRTGSERERQWVSENGF